MLLSLFLAASLMLTPSSLLAQGKKRKAKQEHAPVVAAKSTTNLPEAQAHFDQAANDIGSKRYGSAIQHYQAALKLDPSFLNALDHMALAYRQNEQIDSAFHYFRLSTATNPNGLMAHQELASLYASQKDYRNALLEYQEVLRIDPENPDAYLGISKSLFMLENFTGAIESGKKAVQIYDKAKATGLALGEAQYFVGMAFYYTDNRESAKLYLKRAKSNGVSVPKDLQQQLNIK